MCPCTLGAKIQNYCHLFKCKIEIASKNYVLDNFINWVGFNLPKDTLNSWNKMQFLIGTNFWNTLYISEVI